MSAKASLTKITVFNGKASELYEDVINRTDVHWDEFVDSTLELSGLSIFSNLTNPTEDLGHGSTARALGHNTLEEFITATIDHKGMGMAWDAWVTHVEALRISKEVGINAATAQELVTQYNAVCDVLGYKTKSSTDYMQGLSKAQAKIVDRVRAENEATIRNLKIKIEGLMSDLNSEKASKGDLQSRIEELNKAMGEIRNEHERAMHVQEVTLRGEHQIEMEDLKREKAREIEELRMQFMAQIDELTQKVQSLEDQFTNGEWVESSEYDRIKEENQNYKNKIAEYVQSINALEKDISVYRSRITEIEGAEEATKAMIDKLQAEIEEYENRDFASSERMLKSMSIKASKYEEYLKAAKEKQAQLKLKYDMIKHQQAEMATHMDSLMIQRERYKKKLNIVKRDNVDLNKKAKRNELYYKLAAIIIAGLVGFNIFG